VLSAALVAGIADEELPLTGGQAESLHISPVDSAQEVAAGLGGALAHEPVLLGAALAAALAAAILPLARRRSRFGVAAVGAVLVVCSVAAGASLVTIPLALLVWAVAGSLAAGARR
jgi:hypothetical protein